MGGLRYWTTAEVGGKGGFLWEKKFFLCRERSHSFSFLRMVFGAQRNGKKVMFEPLLEDIWRVPKCLSEWQLFCLSMSAKYLPPPHVTWYGHFVYPKLFMKLKLFGFRVFAWNDFVCVLCNLSDGKWASLNMSLKVCQRIAFPGKKKISLK